MSFLDNSQSSSSRRHATCCAKLVTLPSRPPQMDELEIKLGSIAFNEITQAPWQPTPRPVQPAGLLSERQHHLLPPPLVPTVHTRARALLPSWMRQEKASQGLKSGRRNKMTKTLVPTTICSSRRLGPHDGERVREVFCRWPGRVGRPLAKSRCTWTSTLRHCRRKS